MQKMKLRALAAWSASLALLCSPALSQTAPDSQADTDTQTTPQAPSSPKSGGSISTGFASGPVYLGSDERRTMAGVIGSYQWANGLSIGANGIGWRLSRDEQLQYGVGLGVSAGRKEGDSIHLRGMGDVKDQLTFRGYVNASVAKGITLSSALELGSGNTRDGGVLQLGATYSTPINATLGLNLSVGVAFANADHMASYFGVNADQSAASGYARYTPSGGLRNVGVGLGLNYTLTPNWALAVGLTGTALASVAKDSPIVRQPNYVSALAGVVFNY